MPRLNHLLLLLLAFAPIAASSQDPDSPADGRLESGNETSEVSTTTDGLAELIESVQQSVLTIRLGGRNGGELAMGTGFVIDSSGTVVTNLHVIGEGRSFTVEKRGGGRLPVLSVEASDRAADLAVILIDARHGVLTQTKRHSFIVSLLGNQDVSRFCAA